MRGNQGWVAPAPSSTIPPAPGVLRRCAARRRSPPSLTSVDSSCDLRPATCDLQPATLTGVAYAGRSGVGSSPSSVPLPRMMFACDALRPPPSPAAPLTPPPSPTAPPNPPQCLGRLRCLLFMAVLSVHVVLRLFSGHGVGKCVGGVGGSSVRAACTRRAGRLSAAPSMSTHEVIRMQS